MYLIIYLLLPKSVIGISLVAQIVKNLPKMQETWVQSLGQDDSLENGVATPSSILAWRIPWAEAPGGLRSRGSYWAGHDCGTNAFTVQLVVQSSEPVTERKCEHMEKSLISHILDSITEACTQAIKPLTKFPDHFLKLFCTLNLVQWRLNFVLLCFHRKLY